MVLSPELVLRAYANGYFPMEEPGTRRLLWFRPDPRAIIPLDSFHVSASLKKTLTRGSFRVTFDMAFSEVMRGCADRKETWIGEDFFKVYGKLARLGHAHSVEVWEGDTLAGGLYGLALGGAFFAESKFHRKRDASKVALHALVERLKQKKFTLLEVQFLTPHLATLGAVEIPGDDYDKRLVEAIRLDTTF